MHSIHHPHQLLEDQLRDLFSAELQIASTMPVLAAHAKNAALQRFLKQQEKVAVHQRERLCECASFVPADPGGDECKAIQALISGGNEHIARAHNELTINLIIVAHTIRLIHYQIAAYEFAHILAARLDLKNARAILQELHQQELKAATELHELSLPIFDAISRQPGGHPR